MKPAHDKNLGHLCSRVAQAFRTEMEKRTQEMGLHFTEVLVFLYLDGCGPSSLAEISRDMHFAHPSVLRQIDGLEQAGYVSRIPHPKDRRVKVIHLTTKGKGQVKTLIDIAKNIHKKATTGFNSRKTEQLRTDLMQLIQNLNGNKYDA
jgi:DNA-binding MarR family transcriptional regulator